MVVPLVPPGIGVCERECYSQEKKAPFYFFCVWENDGVSKCVVVRVFGGDIFIYIFRGNVIGSYFLRIVYRV